MRSACANEGLLKCILDHFSGIPGQYPGQYPGSQGGFPQVQGGFPQVQGGFPQVQGGFPQILGPTQYPGGLPMIPGGLPMLPINPAPFTGGQTQFPMSSSMGQGVVVLCPLDLIYPSAPFHPVCQSPNYNMPLTNLPPPPPPLSPLINGNSFDQSRPPPVRMLPGQSPMMPPPMLPLLELNSLLEPVPVGPPLNLQQSCMQSCSSEALKLLGIRPQINSPLTTGMNQPQFNLPILPQSRPLYPQQNLVFPTGNNLPFQHQNPLSGNMLPFPTQTPNALQYRSMPLNFNTAQYPLNMNTLAYPLPLNTLAQAFPILVATNKLPQFNPYMQQYTPLMQQYSPYNLNRLQYSLMNSFGNQLYFNNPVPIVPVMNGTGTKSLL